MRFAFPAFFACLPHCFALFGNCHMRAIASGCWALCPGTQFSTVVVMLGVVISNACGSWLN